ncbi:MAG: hypothetical protein WCE62_05070 [Polyangiales bacterium]
MPQSADSSETAPILFCPFCREGFEDRMECPEHELDLVPIERLPRAPDPVLEGVTFFADPRLGRGAVLLGASLVLIGFVTPFVRATGVRASEISASALEVAIDGAGNLWLPPGVAAAILWIVWRRRSRVAMRAARAAVFGLAVGGALPLLYTTRRIGLVAEGFTADVEWRWGLSLMLAGLLVVALGARRMGAG